MTFLLLYLEYKQTLFFSAAEIACRHTTCYEDIINSEKVPDFLPPSLPSSSELLSISQGFVKGQKKTVHLLASCHLLATYDNSQFEQQDNVMYLLCSWYQQYEKIQK